MEYARCWATAELATEILPTRSETSADGEIDPGLRGVPGLRNEVHQAQGTVMVALGISLVEALARMRAHAFAPDRDLVGSGGVPDDGEWVVEEHVDLGT